MNKTNCNDNLKKYPHKKKSPQKKKSVVGCIGHNELKYEKDESFTIRILILRVK